MSVILKLKDIPEDKFSLIMNSLTMIPVNKREEDAKKWGNKMQTFQKSKEPVIMYLVEGDTIRLPLKFASGLFNQVFNNNLNHLQIINDNVPEFKAQLRDYQIPQATEIYEYLRIHSTVTIGLPPGEGKTILGAWCCYVCKLMFLIIVPREKLLDQWYETFRKSIPGLLGNIWIPGVNSPPTSGYPAGIICMNTRVDMIPQVYKDAVGTFVVDEAHMLCSATMVKVLLCVTPRYVILETATLERTDQMESMVQCIAGKHGIFKVSTKPYHIYKIETDVNVEEEHNKMGIDYSKLVNKTCNDELYNAIILNIIKSNLNHKFIILTKLVDHANNLCNWLTIMGIKADTLVGTKKDYNDSKVLIGTSGKISTGFDESTGCHDFGGVTSNVIMILPSVKEYQAFEQSRGRIMRNDNPIVVWINTKNKTIRGHFNGLKNWMEATNATVITKVFRPDEIIL